MAMLAAPGHSISQLEKLAIMWSAKEAVFKWWGWGSVDFSEEILLQPSALSGQGFMAAGFVRNAEVFPLTLQYKLFEELCLVWVASQCFYEKSLGGDGFDRGWDVKQTADGGYILAGESNSGGSGDVSDDHPGNNCWIVKLFKDPVSLASATLEDNLSITSDPKNHDFKIYPNPVADAVHIQVSGSSTFSLIDFSGKILVTTKITGSGSIAVNNFSPGIYYLKNNTTGKFQKVLISR